MAKGDIPLSGIDDAFLVLVVHEGMTPGSWEAVIMGDIR
jgi:hypothetical protein